MNPTHSDEAPSITHPFRLTDILRGVCPRCRKGKIYRSYFRIHPKCIECRYDFYPESGFYLGAIMVSYLLTAILTVPFLIFLKISEVELTTLFIAPLVEYLFLGTFLMRYSRVVWLYLESTLTNRLEIKR